MLGRSLSSSSRILRPRKVSSKPRGDRTRRSSSNIARARCNALLTAGWLSSRRDAAAVMVFSCAIAANVIRRFKSTWRSFSKRMAIITIMHDSHKRVRSSFGLCKAQDVYNRRIQSHEKTVSKISEWSSWVGRRELVWLSPTWQHHRERRFLLSQAMRNEFTRQSNPSEEKRRERRLTSPTNGPFAHFFTKLGAFDHLVFTAGDSLHLHNLAATDLKQARRAFELRYWSALAVVKYGSPQIRKGGSVVLTTGVAGQRPHTGWVIAASVCGAIEALTRTLAIEFAPIRVNAVSLRVF